MERLIIHVDVNNAFLSWSAVDRLNKGEKLDIRTIPAVVGGDEESRHGIVLAKSMLAKSMGIVTGEPLYFARQKCKNLLVINADFKVYKKYSDELYQILSSYTDKIERFSIDECFLDLTCSLLGKTVGEIAKEIQKRVKEELGFTVNIGISTNKLLAKMASDFQKPDRIHTLYLNEIQKKIWNLDVSELFMVGRKSVDKLKGMRINTIGELARTDRNLLIKRFGKFGNLIWEYANGIDSTEVVFVRQKPKGIGNETTLSMDLSDYNKICEYLLPLVEETSYRLRKENMSATVVNIKVKTKDFVLLTHQRKLQSATDSTKEIYNAAKELLKEVLNNNSIRLVGVRVDGLVDNNSVQLSFFDTKDKEKQKRLDQTVDKIKEKFGYNVITRAGELNKKQ